MRVLLAIDGSESSQHAARLLARLPHQGTLELFVVTAIVHPTLHPADATVAWPPEVWESLNASARQGLDEIVPMFEGADATVTSEILEGHAGESIVERAKAIRADLIVVGAKGHSAIERILLGSVSDYVARHADCDVMVIRPNSNESGSLSAVVAYDGSERSDQMLARFSQFDWGHQSQVDVLTVIPVVKFFGKLILPNKRIDREPQHRRAEAAAKHAVTKLAEANIDASSHVMEAEHIGDEIVRYAKERQAELIVVGATGMSGLSRIVMGSVSSYVLRHALRSVWITRT